MRYINATTLEHRKGWNRAVIGDSRANSFEPRVSLSKWDDECYIDISWSRGKGRRNSQRGKTETDSKGNITKVKWIEDDLEVHKYDKEPEEYSWKYTDARGTHTVEETVNSEGGFELEFILKTKPSQNYITLPVTTKGLIFYYQPPLHPDHPTWADKNGDGIADTFRPPHVVGSYAVYATKGNVHRSKEKAEKYKAGKAFHIYRPKIIDANNDMVWGKLNIDEQTKTLTITIDRNWLDNAVYPVTIDPTFGYETVGGTSAGSERDKIYNLRAAPSEDGTADNITVYGKAFTASDEAPAKCALYSATGSYPTQGGEAPQSTEEHYTSATEGWQTWNFVSPKPSISSAQTYWICFVMDDYFVLLYDSTSGGGYTWATNGNYNYPTTWPDPVSWPLEDERKLSIYVTYTAAVAAGSVLKTTSGVLQTSSGVISTQ